MFNRIKGTQDFLDLTLFNFIIQKAKEWLLLHNFAEVSTPIIEPIQLFERSLGIDTDVIAKEIYLVSNTKDDTHAICLRPELTAPLVRAFVNSGIDSLPWKAFTYGPVFRHERPQKGRYRQFHQVSIEVIGAQAIAQDAALISMLDKLFLEKLSLTSYALLLNFLGCEADQNRFKNILKTFLDSQAGLCETCLIRKEKTVLRIFDCKSSECQAVYKQAPKTVEHLCIDCTKEWSELQSLLYQLSVSFSIDPWL
ncbi:MAG TPA: aminoacyl--tRNA ligase-related protein, partial [Candidatus Babeliaceae bacterium]|nr:aminoacyl--tRNA ligase-related protein [Candidatus Babeliaceae bacterium]